MNQPNTKRVVITGAGAVTPLGNDAATSIAAMAEGRSGVATITGSYFDTWPEDQWPVRIAGQAKDFDPDNAIDPRQAKRLDRFTQLGVTAAVEAVQQSGINFENGNPTRRGVIVGSGVGGIQTIENMSKVLWDKGPRKLSPFTVPRLMGNAISGDLAIRFNLQGPSDTHVTACASAGHSMAGALALMRQGLADVMLVGGSEAAVSPLCIGAFMNMKALSTRNNEPEKASRPFDKDRDGFVLSEGAAVFVLETLEHAEQRGANIICELTGAASSTDAHHITAPDPEGRGAQRSMIGALEDARLNPDDIGYINAHGTSTPLGDAAEVNAVKSVFNHRAKPGSGLLMSSTKSMVGHCLGASGAIETLACIAALKHDCIPPTINLDEPDPEFTLDLVPHEARQATPRHAMNNTFGFGGHNLTLVFSRYEGN